jgi:hypothetical protein
MTIRFAYSPGPKPSSVELLRSASDVIWPKRKATADFYAMNIFMSCSGVLLSLPLLTHPPFGRSCLLSNSMRPDDGERKKRS